VNLRRQTIAIGAAFAIAGCATPFQSHVYDESPTTRGFVYRLTSSSTEVKFGVRLTDCAPTLNFEVLPPAVNPTPVADEKYRFRIDPAESANVFKTLDEAKITLTADGRLASAAAKTTDEILPLVGKALEVAFTGMTLSPADVQRAKVARQVAHECTDAANSALTLRNDLVNAKQVLLARQQTYIASSSFDQSSSGILRAFTSATADIDKRIADADAAITSSVTVVLKPDADSKIPFVGAAFVDPAAAWKKDASPSAVKFDGTKCKCGSLSNGTLLFCASLSPAKGVATPHPPSPADLAKSEGIFYRIPAVGTVTMTGQTCSNAATALNKQNVAPRASRKLRSTPPDNASPEALGSVDVPVPQWGPVSILSGNFGPFASAGVQFEFDEWSVPKSVTWSAQNGGLAGLLGFAGQVQAQRAAANAPVDPADALRASLLQRLLESCLNAPATALPDYCAGLVP